MLFPKVCKLLQHFKAKKHGKFDTQLFRDAEALREIPNDPYPKIVYGLRILPEHCGIGNILHRGAILTLIDIMPAIHFFAIDTSGRFIVTSSIKSSFYQVVQPGELLEIITSVESIQGKFIFCSATLQTEGRIIGITHQQYALMNKKIIE